MKTSSCAAILTALLIGSNVFGSEGIIHNDTIWRDTAGSEIWCNGGQMLREGNVFYWVGYDTGPGRWPWRINLLRATQTRPTCESTSDQAKFRRQGHHNGDSDHGVAEPHAARAAGR